MKCPMSFLVVGDVYGEDVYCFLLSDVSMKLKVDVFDEAVR